MEEFRKNIQKVDKDLFDKINELLKDYGIDNAEVTSLKIRNTNPQALICPPDKIKYCWADINGKIRCRCV